MNNKKQIIVCCIMTFLFRQMKLIKSDSKNFGIVKKAFY